MNTSSLIKQAFGNHRMLRQYLEFLREPDALPPFIPVLYRTIANGNNDSNIIIENARSRHNSINRLVLRELNNNYNIYQELQNR